MNKPFLLTIIVLAMATPIWVIAESTGQKYTCPMHPEVVMDAPGKCPKCGMTLVPGKEKKKRPTPNAERRTPNEKKKQSAHDEHDMGHHEMTMGSSLKVADPISRDSS